MVWPLVQPAGPRRQSVNVAPWAASASTWPEDPSARVAVHLGSAGSRRHAPAGPDQVSPSAALRMMPMDDPGPTAVDVTRRPPVRSGGDSVQAAPLLAIQPAWSVPVPARSSTTMPEPVAARRSTPMFSLENAAARRGPVACQVPLVSAKRPATPGRAQVAASMGTPAGLNAAPVRPVTPQARPAGVAARVLAVIRRVQLAPRRWLSSAPPLVSALSRPPGPAASASGTSARPGSTGPAADQDAPLLVLVASGENVRSWLGRKPVSSGPAGVPATTRPPLSATPAGVAS